MTEVDPEESRVILQRSLALHPQTRCKESVTLQLTEEMGVGSEKEMTARDQMLTFKINKSLKDEQR